MVDEDSLDPDGNFGGIYQVIDDLDPYAEQELYYFTFEVKTQCGWRSEGHPDGYVAGGDPPYGPHSVSGWVEWKGTGSFPDISRQPSDQTLWNQFYAYGTSETVGLDPGYHLTRFCGRAYRPSEATQARIVIIAEGFMPHDGDPNHGVRSEVYIDNVYFFKAPPIKQVKGTGLLTLGGNVALYDLDTGTPLNLSMNADLTPNDSYLRIAGTLINPVGQPAKAIDLGFAFPIFDDESSPPSQQLEWYYDNRDSLVISRAEVRDRDQPFIFTGPIDVRPKSVGKRSIPTSKFKHNHNQQISVYPFSALGIDQGADPVFGLSFGDSLEDEPLAPSISHFGYRVVDDDVGDELGYYYVEFNIGLLDASTTATGTDFSFIIFRSDDEIMNEYSSFREGLEKYQTDIYEQWFARPTGTIDTDWMFGGGFLTPQELAIHPPGEPYDTDGFNGDPNDFGFRYSQGGGEELLTYCATNNLGCQIYQRPWEGTFENDHAPEYDKNRYEKLRTERDSYTVSGGPYPNNIYDKKLNALLKIPPENQEIFSPKPYEFPVLVSTSPTIADDLVEAHIVAYDHWYEQSTSIGDCYSGIELDNTFNFDDSSNHLDLFSDTQADFVLAGGRLTYSFNHFAPAIPQLCTNVWFFPHLKTTLAGYDSAEYAYGDNATSNIADEIVSVNAMEKHFGGSKYGIINADVIGFESAADMDFNNCSHSFNFRRALAREKSVARLLKPFKCNENAMDTIFGVLGGGGGGSGTHLWGSRELFVEQVMSETCWISLAWGFHPSIGVLVPPKCIDLDDQGFDDFVEDEIRPKFSPTDPVNEADVGFTEIFRQLHLAGWRPVTNVVNAATATTMPGDPEMLYIERFGPRAVHLPPRRPVYLTVLNNNDFKLTLTDVADYESLFKSITEMDSELEVEQSGICNEVYGEASTYDTITYQDITALGDGEDKNFYLIISDLEAMTLQDGNLFGMQMVSNKPLGPGTILVNYPVIRPGTFSANGQYYSLVRFEENDEDKISLGGFRFMGGRQQPGEIQDKALMVFKIWAEAEVNNDGQGGEGSRTSMANPYYQRVGDWSTVSDETAREGSVDVISSEETGAYALFSVDVGGNAAYDVRVAYPESIEATSGARYEVYLQESYYDEIDGETVGTLTGPVLTAVVDQSRRATEAMDEEGFISIGEIEAHRPPGVDRFSVVVRLSSTGAEYHAGRATVLMADAVKVERID